MFTDRLTRARSASALSLAILIGALPLVVYETLPDPWTGSKWAFLSIGVGALSLIFFRSIKLTFNVALWFAAFLGLIFFASRSQGLLFFWQEASHQLLTFALACALFRRFDQRRFRQWIDLALAFGWIYFFTGVLAEMLVSKTFSFNELGGSLGQVNMSADFAVLALGLLLSKRSLGTRRVFWNAMFASFAFYVGLTLSRAALIGVVLVFLASCFLHWRRRRMRLVAVALGLAGGLAVALALQSGGYGFVREVKESSTHDRIRLYESTVDIIAHVPQGLGLGRFEFGASPWLRKHDVLKPYEIFKAPHSEPLRFAAEGGWAVAVFLIFTLVLVLRSFRFRKSRVALPFWAATIAPLAFQFPLEVATSAALIALGLSRAWPRPSQRPWRPAAVGIFFCAALVLAFGVVHAVAGRSFSLAAGVPSFACRWDPTNWRLCEEVAREKQEAGEADFARGLLEKQLELRPYNYSVLHTLSVLEGRTGRQQRSCDIAERYVAFFPITRDDFPECDFLFLDTERLFETYEAWLKSEIHTGQRAF